MQQADEVLSRPAPAGSSHKCADGIGAPDRGAVYDPVFRTTEDIDEQMTALGDVSALLAGADAIIMRVEAAYGVPSWIVEEMRRIDRLMHMAVGKIEATINAVYDLDAQIVATVKP